MPRVKLTREESQLVAQLQAQWNALTKPYERALPKYREREAEFERELAKLEVLQSARPRDEKKGK